MRKCLLAATVIVALAGCSTNEPALTPTMKQITFSNLNDRVGTRSANENADDYRLLAVTADGADWYIDDVVGGTSNLPAAGPYYWLQPASDIEFWAYAPATAGVQDRNFPAVSVEYTVTDAADEDFTIADKVTAQSGTVQLTFRHVLAKISVSAKLSDALTTAGYVITGAPTATLGVNMSKGLISPTDVDPQWSNPEEAASYSGAVSYMILPQPAVGTTVRLNDIVISKGGSVIFSGALSVNTIGAGIVPGDVFAKGRHYAVSIGINNLSTDDNGDPVFGSEILFSASVADWDTIGGIDTPVDQN